MERRRRALGVRKPKDNPQAKPSKPTSSLVENSSTIRSNRSSKMVQEGKDSFSGQRGSSISDQSTPKRKSIVTPMKAEQESSVSPLVSPCIQPMFLRTISSPEIEVSWDWGCSQGPKDIMPTRRVKLASEMKLTTLLEPEVARFPRLPPGRQMSEEENQERLAFYKNLLSNSCKHVPDKVLADSTNNNLESEIVPLTTPTTPQRPRKSCSKSTRKKEPVNEFFDDSANEFMYEFSQAIEEKLKNGEIDSGPIVNVTIPTQKHAHSPALEEANNKKMCHERPKLNLFPEVSNNTNEKPRDKRPLSLKSPRTKQGKTIQNIEIKQSVPNITMDYENDDDILFMRPTQVNPALASKRILEAEARLQEDKNQEKIGSNNLVMKNHAKVQINLDKKSNIPSKPTYNSVGSSNFGTLERRPLQLKERMSVNNNFSKSGNYNAPLRPGKGAEQALTNINRPTPNCEGVDRFRSGQNSNSICNVNNNLPNPQSGCDIVGKKSTLTNTVLEQNKVNGMKASEPAQNKSTNHLPGSEPDITSLLDDGLDMELSSLDFDSLCCSSQPEAKLQAVPKKEKSIPKMCSQQEIEAKRIAALNRLMLKKKR